MNIEAKNLSKIYGDGENRVVALDHANLEIVSSDFISIMGPSGSGKSTLLHLLSGLDKPSSGSLTYDGKDIYSYSDKELSAFRRKRIGFIFQQFNLLPVLTAKENIIMPLLLDKQKPDEAYLKQLTELLGIQGRLEHLPHELSGGQQQRVAIARALATKPKVLLCDEATSALDPNTTHQILQLIRELNRELGITVVIITHQMSVVKEICDKVAILDGGEVAEEGLVSAVFAAPKSAAGRRLVFPSGADALVSDPASERRVRLIFRDSQTTGIPLVARLAAEESIYANVISASTQKLSEEVYGSMLLGIPNSQFDRAWQFYRTIPNLQEEEVSVDVQ